MGRARDKCLKRYQGLLGRKLTSTAHNHYCILQGEHVQKRFSPKEKAKLFYFVLFLIIIKKRLNGKVIGSVCKRHFVCHGKLLLPEEATEIMEKRLFTKRAIYLLPFFH